MGDQSIPPPDFNAGPQFEIGGDEVFAEEADSFHELMKYQSHDEEKIQEEARSQIKNNEDSLKTLVQKEEMDKEAQFEDEEKGIEEEDSKNLSEKEGAELSEEARLSSLKESKATFLSKKEVDETDKKKMGLEQDVKSIKKQFAQDLKKEHRGDLVEDLDHELELKESAKTSKLHANSTRMEEEHAEQKSFSQSHPHEGSKNIKTFPEKKSVQSIAVNLALGAAPLEASKAQKGTLNPKVEQLDSRKELENFVKQILEEAEVLKNGDEIKTIISLDMPDSIFNRGEIEISAYKYRPLEVNLKFQKFNKEGSKRLQQNQETLKNLLKINSLKVHQLDIIE
jgi:hypothetical protein